MLRLHSRIPSLTGALGLLVMFLSGTALAQYKMVKLDSNLPGIAKHQDTLLINAWGLAYGPSSPFWISDAGDGWSTTYNGQGVLESARIIVPSAGSGAGSPTGIVYNGSSEFNVEGWSSIFLFATLDGTISGWSPISNPTHAIIAVNNSGSGAVYTGLAITSKPSGNFIFAADLANNKVDVYDGSFGFVTSFTDPGLPAGWGPFGIQDINGKVYVAFAPASGHKGGIVDVFSEAGVMLKHHFIHGAPLNQPWGFALAPANFGALSNALLISNNTNSGTINGFDAKTGKFIATITNSKGPIVIDQLWGIEFGGGTAANGRTNRLYFTAGPKNNLDGTFGEIETE
ncbi:MAG: TIGR03118 family protein [Terriglobales bacterium]